MSSSDEHAPRRLLGFRSKTPWKSLCALVFFCLLYLAFVLTLMPPVAADNHDQLVYKAVRATLFAAAILPVVLLSDFAWCKRIPFFSSPRASQRALGVAVLASLLVLLGANLTYLHSPEYRSDVAYCATKALGASDANAPASIEDAGATGGTEPNPASESTQEADKGTRGAWNERREGCGTD